MSILPRLFLLLGLSLLLIACRVDSPPAPVAATVSPLPPTITPDLAGLEQQPWSTTSPDGTWIVEGLTALPTQSGEQYYTEMRIRQVDGELSWMPVAGWQPFGLGYTTPRLVHWSTDGRYLYYTNAPHPDGCGLFVNASDLQRLDLTDGTVQEILPQNSTWVLEAAPDGTIAYVDGTTLVLFDPKADMRQEIFLDFAQANVQLGNLVWSPDSQRLRLPLPLTRASYPTGVMPFTPLIAKAGRCIWPSPRTNGAFRLLAGWTIAICGWLTLMADRGCSTS
jgi:hypothetical protein